MSKVIFELTDVRMTPNSEPKLNVEVKFEPLRQNGRAKELAERIIDTIEKYTEEQGGFHKIKNVRKY